MNLRTIPHLSEAFQMPVGLSDHTLGIASTSCGGSLGGLYRGETFYLIPVYSRTG